MQKINPQMRSHFVTILYGKRKWDDGGNHDVLGRVPGRFFLKVLSILIADVDFSLGIISCYRTVHKVIFV